MDDVYSANRKIAKEIETLRAENERLREDAERYLWIRNECEPWRISKWLSRWRHEGESLDPKIDAWRTKKAPTDAD